MAKGERTVTTTTGSYSPRHFDQTRSSTSTGYFGELVHDAYNFSTGSGDTYDGYARDHSLYSNHWTDKDGERSGRESHRLWGSRDPVEGVPPAWVTMGRYVDVDGTERHFHTEVAGGDPGSVALVDGTGELLASHSETYTGNLFPNGGDAPLGPVETESKDEQSFGTIRPASEDSWWWAGTKAGVYHFFVVGLYGGGKALVTGEAGRQLGERGVTLVENRTGEDFTGAAGEWTRFAQAAVGEIVGTTPLVEGISGYDIADYRALDGWERGQRGAAGVSALAGTAAGSITTAGRAGLFTKLDDAARTTSGATVADDFAQPVTRTNAELVQEIARRAERKFDGKGGAVGSLKHGYADRLLTRYQKMFGDRGLTTEARYIDQRPWVPGDGLSDTVRLDVVEGLLESPTSVFDYKFGTAKLTDARIDQIRDIAGFGPEVPIIEVKP